MSYNNNPTIFSSPSTIATLLSVAAISSLTTLFLSKKYLKDEKQLIKSDDKFISGK